MKNRNVYEMRESHFRKIAHFHFKPLRLQKQILLMKQAGRLCTSFPVEGASTMSKAVEDAIRWKLRGFLTKKLAIKI
ncbi:hypothetical protein ABN764_00370 [Paenibacillaceae sp. P-4]|uniref:hypothetical protein n=1 Tax=Paenibacillaceae bacterium P-4 TaxID=3160969 RepID=UPI0032E81E9F